MKKKILSAMLALVCLITGGLCFSGCEKDDTPTNETSKMTTAQINQVFKTAATDFYATHKKTENYSAITYHFVETEKSSVMEKLNYKANSLDEEYTEGTFEQKTNSTTESTLAIKKEGEHLVAELNVVITTTEIGKDVAVEDETLVPFNNTTVETKKYRMFHYTEESEQKNILVYNYNKTFNGQEVPEEEVKAYARKKVYFSEEFSMENYDEFVDETLIDITNGKIANLFFEYVEAILFYDSILNIEQNDNQVKFSFGYNIVSVDSDNWGVADISSSMSSYFKNGKIWKAECSTVHTFETGSMERTVNFDYTNDAYVDMQIPADLSDYLNDGDIWNNNGNLDGSLRAALYDLPSIAIF